MGRIEEFTRDGKNFIYLDLSGFKTNDEFTQFIEESKPVIEKHAEQSLYTITNVENVRFDTKTKELVAQWTEHNKPYVKFGAIIGGDGIKKMMANMAFAISKRANMTFVSSKEQAIEWLSKQVKSEK
jgi:hypothetical protein